MLDWSHSGFDGEGLAADHPDDLVAVVGDFLVSATCQIAEVSCVGIVWDDAHANLVSDDEDGARMLPARVDQSLTILTDRMLSDFLAALFSFKH